MKKRVILSLFLLCIHSFAHTVAVAKEVFGENKKDAEIEGSDRPSTTYWMSFMPRGSPEK